MSTYRDFRRDASKAVVIVRICVSGGYRCLGAVGPIQLNNLLKMCRSSQIANVVSISCSEEAESAYRKVSRAPLHRQQSDMYRAPLVSLGNFNAGPRIEEVEGGKYLENRSLSHMQRPGSLFS